MPLRTNAFQVFPWKGGLDRSQRASQLKPDNLTRAENIIIDGNSTRVPREGINASFDDRSTDLDKIIHLDDFWFETLGEKDHNIVSITEAGSVYRYNLAGASTDISNSSYTLGPTKTADTETFGNRLVIATRPTTGSTTLFLLEGTDTEITRLQDNALFTDGDPEPPNCSILRTHIGRLWTNDLSNKDRLHYTETGNMFKWQGVGDSGALDIEPGDGDPEGITAIFPTFRGDLIVAKKTKLYRVTGTTPETFQVQRISNGIGCESHQAVAAVDTNDVLWVSNRGVHSLNATDAFGDFSSKFVSASIQQLFNDDVETQLLPATYARYLPALNSVAFTFSINGSATNSTIFWYNIEYGQWFTWPDIDVSAITRADDGDRDRLYIGRSDGRVAKTQTNIYIDVDTGGNEQPYIMRLTTGRVSVDGTMYTTKSHKKISLLYTANDSHQITASLKIDNHDAQTTTYTTNESFPLLGSSFILATSLLGDRELTGPYTVTQDGFGRAFELDVQQTINREWVEIEGFVVEWEAGDAIQEFRSNGQ